MSPHKPVTDCFSGGTGPVGLRDESPASFPSCVFWGPISQAKALKVAAPAVGSRSFHPFDPQGETVRCEFSPGYVTVPGEV